MKRLKIHFADFFRGGGNMLEYMVVKLPYKNIKNELENILNTNTKNGWTFVETRTISNYMWKVSSDTIVIFSKEKI
jgi:hypothetical protein